MNINPPSPKIWRNYNYPLGQVPRYPGTFRIKTKMAIRASTAAPTFFTPIQYNGGLYCDGALVANNPTAIAVQEAKVRNIHINLNDNPFSFRIIICYSIFARFYFQGSQLILYYQLERELLSKIPTFSLLIGVYS